MNSVIIPQHFSYFYLSNTTDWERTVHVSHCSALYIVDASLSHYVGNRLFLCFKIIKGGSCNLALIV